MIQQRVITQLIILLLFLLISYELGNLLSKITDYHEKCGCKQEQGKNESK